MELPKDLVEFLNAGNQLNYNFGEAEVGRVLLLSADEIHAGVIWLEPEDESDCYYEIPAVNLVKDCNGYDPEFILLWLPNEKVFGAWDCDHWVLTIFPKCSWSDIANNPLPYLNAQWYPDSGVGTTFRNSGKYKPISGRPF